MSRYIVESHPGAPQPGRRGWSQVTQAGHGTIIGRAQAAYLIHDHRGSVTVRYRSEFNFDGEEPTVGDLVTLESFAHHWHLRADR
jgi:hypothetical protein